MWLVSIVWVRRWSRAVAGLAVAFLVAAGLTACSSDADEASMVVSGYLAALARGDSTGALAFGEVGQPAGPLLTDAVLAASLAEAPLMVESVGKAQVAHDATRGYDTATVTARYAVGGHQVSCAFALTHRPDGWRMDRSYAHVEFLLGPAASTPGPGPSSVSAVNAWLYGVGDENAVGLTLNGVPISDPKGGFSLFPGVYRLAVTNPLVTLTGGQFTVLTLDDQAFGDARPDSPDVRLELTAAAQQRIGALAQATLGRCLQEHSLHTSCGIGEGYGRYEGDVVESTLVWSVEPPGLDMTRWQWELDRGAAVPAGPAYQADHGTYSLLSRGTGPDGKAFSMSSYLQAVCARIADPNNITVTFSDKGFGLAPEFPPLGGWVWLVARGFWWFRACFGCSETGGLGGFGQVASPLA